MTYSYCRQTMIATDSHSHCRTVYCQAVSLAVVHANHACMQHQACQLWLSTGCPQWSSQVPPLLLLLLLLLLLSLLLVLVLQLLVPTAAAAEGRLLRPTAPSCESTHPVGCPVPTHRAAARELPYPALRCVKAERARTGGLPLPPQPPTNGCEYRGGRSGP